MGILLVMVADVVMVVVLVKVLVVVVVMSLEWFGIMCITMHIIELIIDLVIDVVTYSVTVVVVSMGMVLVVSDLIMVRCGNELGNSCLITLLEYVLHILTICCFNDIENVEKSIMFQHC